MRVLFIKRKWKTYSGTTCLICGFTYPSTALAARETYYLKLLQCGIFTFHHFRYISLLHYCRDMQKKNKKLINSLNLIKDRHIICRYVYFTYSEDVLMWVEYKTEIADTYRVEECSTWQKPHLLAGQDKETEDDSGHWCGQPESEWRSLWLYKATDSKPASHLAKQKPKVTIGALLGFRWIDYEELHSFFSIHCMNTE